MSNNYVGGDAVSWEEVLSRLTWPEISNDQYCPQHVSCQHATIESASNATGSPESSTKEMCTQNSWSSCMRHCENNYSDWDMDADDSLLTGPEDEYVLEDGCVIACSIDHKGEFMWRFYSGRGNGECERHHLCIQPPKAERHVVPRMLPPATREREDMKLPRAYLEQLSSQCINTQWHLDSLRHQSAHDFACLRDKYEQLVNAHSELQHHHNLFAKKHDCLIDITIMLCNEMQLHASVMKELNDWRLQSENARSTVSTGYDSPEFILHASPSTTPVCEIHLPEVESHCAPLNSPASSASAPPSPRIGTSDNAADPTLFLKLRCLQSEKGTDAEQTSMESHRELCLAPPDSATMDPSETNEVENLINGIQNDDELGAKERRRSTRGTKPSVKRRNQVHPGVPKKRSKA